MKLSLTEQAENDYTMVLQGAAITREPVKAPAVVLTPVAPQPK